MNPKYTVSPGSDLPETVTSTEVDRSVYKYSVPESGLHAHSTVYSVPTDDASSPIPTYTEAEKPRSEQSKWTRWPLLLLYGLLLMIIAGLAGGFIGKTLERNSNSNTSALSAASDSCPSAVSSPAPISSQISSPTSASASASAPAATSSSSVFERTIASPSSGCTASDPYRSFKSRSNFLSIPYTTICGQGWLDYELTAMNVATQSDCIESCSMYNAHKSKTDRVCVGGGFIPSWWDQKTAMKESGITPYNCFLKTNTSGIARNNEKFEVIALCMDGECDNIKG